MINDSLLFEITDGLEIKNGVIRCKTFPIPECTLIDAVKPERVQDADIELIKKLAFAYLKSAIRSGKAYKEIKISFGENYGKEDKEFFLRRLEKLHFLRAEQEGKSYAVCGITSSAYDKESELIHVCYISGYFAMLYKQITKLHK